MLCTDKRVHVSKLFGMTLMTEAQEAKRAFAIRRARGNAQREE